MSLLAVFTLRAPGDAGLPNTDPLAPPAEVTGPLQTLVGWVFWFGFVACLIGIAVQAIRMVIAKRRQEEFDGMGWGTLFLGVIALAAGGSLLTGLVGV